jgi:dTDP-4-dehydrorhamnose 3,5-epimerase
MIVDAIEHLITSDTYGTYNLSNDGVSASWADISREIFTQLGRSDLKVINTSTEAYYFEKENIAPRPLKSTLDLSKIKSTGFTPTDWKQELKTYIEKERN